MKKKAAFAALASAAALAAIALTPALARAENGGKVDGFYGSFGTDAPITIPGFHGLEPTVKLLYSSSGGTSFVGVGWSLGGASYIGRASPGKGAPSYDASDVFHMDGQELVPCTELGGTHCTKIQSYQRITHDPSANRWYAWRKDGTKATYTALFETSKGTFRWGLATVVDTHGNTVTFNHWCDKEGPVEGQSTNECYLDTITYNGTTIRFYRESRPDTATYATGAGMAKMRYRLKTIDVQVAGSRARAYALSYVTSSSTGRSCLSSVQQYGRDAVIVEDPDSTANGSITSGTALTPMQMGQSDPGPTAWATATVPSQYGWNFGLESSQFPPVGGDFNGDGKADFIRLGGTTHYLYTSNGDGTFTATDVPSQHGWNFNIYSAYYPPLGGDFNGDGLSDFIRLGATQHYLYTSNGDGTFTATGVPSQNGWNFNIYSAYYPGLSGDFNGDGKTDFIRLGGTQHYLYTSNGDGTFTATGVPSQNGWNFNIYSAYYPSFAGDFNGDGKTDFIRLGATQHYLYTSNGDGTFIATGVPAQNGWNFGVESKYYPPLAGDFNGDGKTDFIRLGATTYYLYISNGDGTFNATGVPAQNGWYFGYTNEFYPSFAGDFNADGRTDFIRLAGSGGYLYTSNGDGTFNAAYVPSNTGWNFTSNSQYFPSLPGDFNGDGKTDFIRLGGTEHYLFNTTGSVPDLLTNLSNGVGGTTSIEYTPSSAWPNTYLPVGMIIQTASSLTTSDGRGGSSSTSYQYAGGLWTDSESRFLGFRKVTGVINAAGDYTETYYHQHVGCISKPETTYFKDATGKIYSYSQMTYQESASAPYTSLMTERWDYECNLDETCRRVLTQLGYDSYGNLIEGREHGDYDVLGDERTTIKGFYPNTSAYIVAHPAYENRYDGIGTTGQLVRRTLYTYDANSSHQAAPTVGDQTTIEQWNSETGGYVERTIGYDAYGNPTATTDTRGCTAATQYDATFHSFPIVRCNCLGQCSSETWDTVLGRRTSETGLNGGTASVTYDALGRPLTKTHADGGSLTYEYLDWGNPNLQRTRETLADGTPDGLWKETYQDGLGRQWRVVSEGGITQDTIYSDGSKRVWKKSMPYRSGEAPVWTVKAYDGAGRLVRVTSPDGTYAESVYGDGYVTERSVLGQEKTSWKDGLGRIVQIAEQNGTETYFTTFTHNAADETTQVTDALGNISTTSYSSLGRKLSLCNPDSGCVSFTYDGEGQKLSQTNAKGQTISWSHDQVGRVISKRYPDGSESTWTYDESGHGAGLGRLTTVTSSSGSESLSYDLIGRVTASTKCIAGACYTTSTTYDLAGRTATIAYPDGQLVTYGYNSAGRLGCVGSDATCSAATDPAPFAPLTVGVAEDTYVRAGRNTNYGDRSEVRISRDDTGFLKFDLSGVGAPSVQQAVLRLYFNSNNGGSVVEVHAVADDSWTELGINGDNTPVIDGTVATFTPPGGDWIDVDITNYVNGELAGDKLVSLALALSGDFSSLSCGAREGPNGAQLRLTRHPTPGTEGTGNVVKQIDYNPRGQVVSMTYGNGVTSTFSYDANRAWLADSQVTGATETLYQASYSYDAAARITAVASTTDPLLNVSYTYDDLNRLVAASGAQSQTFAYDALGRMTYNSSVGSYAYGDASHVHAVTAAGANTYNYDANGNVVAGAGRVLTWDAENRPISMTKEGTTITFAYDASGVRVMKSSANGQNAGTTRYFGLFEQTSDGSLAKYIYAGGLRIARVDTQGTRYYHADHLGSVQLMTDESGGRVREADFAPFGAILGESGIADEHGFGGHRRDAESGLVYMGARYYDADLGRFISADSIVPDPANPQSLDRYAFAYNNPVSNVDPTGHAPVVAVVYAIAIAATSMSWVAVVGAVCTVAGYVLKNETLLTIGSVCLGVATGGAWGGLVAAATSPLSPLDPKLKQAIGWAYTAVNLISGIYKSYEDAQSLKGAGGPGEGVDKTLVADNPEDANAVLAKWEKQYGELELRAFEHPTFKGTVDHSGFAVVTKGGDAADVLGAFETGFDGGLDATNGLYSWSGVPEGFRWVSVGVPASSANVSITASVVFSGEYAQYAIDYVCHTVTNNIANALNVTIDSAAIRGWNVSMSAFGGGEAVWFWEALVYKGISFGINLATKSHVGTFLTTWLHASPAE